MASSPYIAPFAKAPISGYDFGAKVPAGGWIGNGSDFGWPVHLGTDFGTQAGEAIVASAPATVKFESGLAGYGNKLTETFDNGWSLVFGHVAAGASGKVAQGQQIGVTGRNVGSAQGAVTLVELRDPSGKARNPDAFIQSLERGGAQAAGSAVRGLGDFTGSSADTLAQGLGGVSAAIAGIPTQVGHGLADFFTVAESDIAEWFKRQSVAFFVAVVVLLVLFV